VSLILDALKKLERDKEAREPHVLVVGSVPWGTRARSRLPLVAAAVGVVVVGLLAVMLWLRNTAPRPATVAPSPGGPSPAPSAAAAPIASPPAPAAPSAAPAAAPEPRRPSLPSGRPEADHAKPAEDTESPAGPATEAGAPKAPGTEELRLTAISRRNGRPVALINDRLLFEGDGFDGVKVLRIGEDEVEVEVRGVKKVLRF
jgi:cell division septation protein DedD